MTAWQMYWITRLDGINFISCGGMLILGLASLICLIGYCINRYLDKDEDVWKLFRRLMAFSIPAFIISTLVAVFVPTTKEMATIIILPKVVNGKVVQKDIPAMWNHAVKWVEEQANKK